MMLQFQVTNQDQPGVIQITNYQRTNHQHEVTKNNIMLN